MGSGERKEIERDNREEKSCKKLFKKLGIMNRLFNFPDNQMDSVQCFQIVKKLNIF